MHVGRRSVLLGLAASVGLIIGCGPEVHQHVTGTAQIWVTGADRALYRVDVALYAMAGAIATNGGHSYLAIDVARCTAGTCGTPNQYIANLKPEGYDTSDMKAIVARYSAFGGPVTVTFSGAGPADQLDKDPSADGTTSASLSSTWSAVAKVTMFGATCEDKAAVASRRTTAYPLEYQPPSNRRDAPIRSVAGTPGRPARCAPPAGRR